jgi:hypothetical protein
MLAAKNFGTKSRRSREGCCDVLPLLFGLISAALLRRRCYQRTGLKIFRKLSETFGAPGRERPGVSWDWAKCVWMPIKR